MVGIGNGEFRLQTHFDTFQKSRGLRVATFFFTFATMNPEENRILEFDASILQNEGMDAAYVEVPFDIKAMFGKGRLLVHATFDGVSYDGQIVKMGTPCYVIGVRKDIRKQIGKSFGNIVHVTFYERKKQ